MGDHPNGKYEGCCLKVYPHLVAWRGVREGSYACLRENIAESQKKKNLFALLSQDPGNHNLPKMQCSKIETCVHSLTFFDSRNWNRFTQTTIGGIHQTLRSVNS
jgi:hypothetical protein